MANSDFTMFDPQFGQKLRVITEDKKTHCIPTQYVGDIIEDNKKLQNGDGNDTGGKGKHRELLARIPLTVFNELVAFHNLDLSHQSEWKRLHKILDDPDLRHMRVSLSRAS